MSTVRLPVAIVVVAGVVGAFLGNTGVDVVTAGLVIAGVVWFVLSRRERRMLLADYIEQRSFPSDTIEELVTSETGTVTIGQARARMHAWRQGYVQAEWDARARRSAAGKKAAETRRRRHH